MKKEDIDNSIKTTINIDKKLWQDFSIKVIKEQGGRKKNDVIIELIRKYLD
jgi:metal-responsive CopG/Arc/MetJ family transcriptional regulator